MDFILRAPQYKFHVITEKPFITYFNIFLYIATETCSIYLIICNVCICE